MGRPIKSTEELIRSGTYRKDRHQNRGVALDALEEISIPETLNKAAAGKWAEIVPALQEAGLVSAVDLPELTDAFLHYGFAQDCISIVQENWASAAEYLAQLNKFKDVDLVAKYSEFMDYFNRIMHRFGVTPTERAKIKVQPKKEDEADSFIRSLRGNG